MKTVNKSPVPRPIKSLASAVQPNGDQETDTGAGEKEPQSAYGAQIAQTALQSVGLSTKNFGGPFTGPPEYALAVSIIFTKATEQTIMLGTPPNQVCSTSILWNSLAHDKRFEQIPMSEAISGDIIIEPGWQKATDGYAGIIVDHGRIVSNSDRGLSNDSSLLQVQRCRPEMAVFRYVGFRNYYRGKQLANAGYNPDESRIPAGQAGGGQWTTGGAGGGGVQNRKASPKTNSIQARPSAVQENTGQLGGAGGGTIDQLQQARQKLDAAYAKEVADIKNMRGITEEERDAGLKSLQEKYNKARNDLDARISKLQQLAQDIAFAYGGKASDYYKGLDDTDPKVQELMAALDHLDSYGFKDVFLLELRHAQGGSAPPPTDPHVLRSASLAGTGVLGEGESAVEKTGEEFTAKAKRAAQLFKNVADGAKREAKTIAELAAENPGKSVQSERTLRDANGNTAVDPVTGEGRRVDHAVIDRDANTAKTYETTGNNVDKRLQIDKEKRIREAGGSFIRDKESGKLTPTDGVSEVRRQK